MQALLEDADVPWVIIGHSERRTLLNEDNTTVGKKVAHARFHGLSVIVCVGETLEEREANARRWTSSSRSSKRWRMRLTTASTRPGAARW